MAENHKKTPQTRIWKPKRKPSVIEKRTKLLPCLSATFNFPFFPFYEAQEKTFECQNLIYLLARDGLNDLKKAASRLISLLLPRLISGSPFSGQLQSAFVSGCGCIRIWLLTFAAVDTSTGSSNNKIEIIFSHAHAK